MKMPAKGITAVLFDWDFTLAYNLQPEMSHIERTAVLFQHVGIHYPVRDFRIARDSLLADIALGRADGAIKPQTRQEIMEFYRQILIRLGYPDTSRDLAYRIYIAYGQLPTTLYDDVPLTLQKLHQAGLVLGILSNHSTTVRPVMENLVGAYIPATHITISEEVGVHKPSKTIFRRAVARLHTPAAQCMYVGDNLNVDAIGAVEQGAYGRGVWLDRANEGTVQDVPPNVNRISRLSQLLDFVLV
ncbi:MAG TPA: HAD family hydrolase [Chloroflexota bacterium]|nr:HAD family hydrolase [Chloroflexota bacterium]